ncbi:hypothetical protein QP519_10445 [Weeksella virosa]|uniref:Erythronolide synthase n=1 Tax=Weeksella virosa (strain ATCC 43766 / DSM 16922 / JCM 21250 / CCUG 30538 / CDC 9751 / IAM 14551 / NBRC 16016 / NCTC 11634 / CL345/78) TaxID=865938 RepID=F0NXR0_WEEVC|nr:hypothetical protein [Weeksella virosa]ADX66967.1 erythronolide synthase [Weeksella virosa DSM 16922]MDK7375953.1 hypothetical protein [Weeksella virosa]VEH63304.1 Uncharacterised protein [Weeksella virosa]
MAKRRNTQVTSSDVNGVSNKEIALKKTTKTNSEIDVLQPDTVEPAQKKAKVIDGRVQVHGQHSTVLVSPKTAYIISKFK